MPTVVGRLEPSKKDAGRGTVYYRIYKGHNRRMEFSSRLHISVISWDETKRTVKGDNPEACRFRTQIRTALELLRKIITEDDAGLLPMGDIIHIFKRQRTVFHHPK